MPNKRTNFIKQEIIPFDIDGINYNRKEEYIAPIADALGVPYGSFTVVFTGNGIQVLVRTDFFNIAFIEKMKPAYHAICKDIEEALRMDDLPFVAVDTTVWCKTQLLRLPFTTNRKPIKAPFKERAKVKPAFLYLFSSEVVSFDWSKWHLEEEKQAPLERPFASEPPEYRPHDPAHVMSECPFLAEQVSTAGKGASYQTWFTALGVTSHFDDLDAAHEWSHKVSSGHADYNQEDTDQKIFACQQASGPRTCKSISLVYAGCASCKHRESGIGSPINLRPFTRSLDPIEEYERENGPMVWGDSCKSEVVLQNSTPTCSKPTPIDAIPQETASASPKLEVQEVASTGNELDWTSYIDAGFTKIELTEKGKPKKPVRLVNELRRYFSCKTHFFNVPFLRRHYVWKDNYFQQITEDEIKAFAQAFYRPHITEEKDRKEFFNNVKVHNIEQKEVMNMAHREGLVNCKNGIFDIHNNRFLPHSPAHKFFHKLPYDYSRDAECPVWDELLANLTCNRPHLQEVIEEFLGWTIVGGPYKPQKILIMYGGGDNGKTTLANIFEMVVGEENASHVSASEIKQPHEAIRLENKLLNVSEEEPENSFHESGPLKRMTGDGFVKVAYLYQNKYDYKNRAKQVITYNTLPKLTDKSNGMRRRLMIVPFELDMSKEPDKRIDNIYGKIEGELSGILNRAIFAYKRLAARGDFNDIPESKAFYDKMILDSDDVLSWLEERIELTGNEDDQISTQEMYDSFCKDTPYQRMTYRIFCLQIKEELERRGIPKCRIWVGKNRPRGYKKIRFFDTTGTSQDQEK